MVDQVQDTQMSPEVAYLNDLLKKFNENPDDPSLNPMVKFLLGQIRTSQQEVSDIMKQVETLNNEIRERQSKGEALIQQLNRKQGESQGYINTILAIRQ